MSVESRLQKLEQALAGRRPPHVIKVLLIVVENREQVAALDRFRAEHPEPPRQPTHGRVELELAGSITAAEYLRQHGVTISPETETLSEEQTQ